MDNIERKIKAEANRLYGVNIFDIRRSAFIEGSIFTRSLMQSQYENLKQRLEQTELIMGKMGREGEINEKS